LKLLDTPKNIKHKVILATIYSAGLRISEVINLRISDVRSAEGFIPKLSDLEKQITQST
jgi:site-specific recombinase XerD